MIYEVFSDIVIYICLPVIIAGSVIMVGLFPFEIKRAIDDVKALRDEPPRRRATDVKPGRSE
ncbi:MAG TPA: hypothetical protein VK669_09135 [Candidatus Limnocylindrales bacterium]|nr:hypothetical protein [Candidatus Limnocylindrales bacterium]